ncbi:hypothetical protein SPRG_05275 [Saprolegnia parasitica CBS 223.65]|uniref:Mitochondrial import inner membrane translocase subunit Tim21 n=1 Tax=Saprolegnia parasitica (strain CBS 223.65) TaxID=695850 RepID=A0A067CH67_SAPPC|nr:hypothetical protein SPRG_05275 [Saprolegnia parasitica CBS 223.65]KDO30084.1 hypothetical protein SPRG_05275 [Saprolegnia parasitica CBS 223.65]|eukprot:XP_012199265.1 hypothetical protein SPRG_05275 [Saprolegnia parasitica CBS 223.65]
MLRLLQQRRGATALLPSMRANVLGQRQLWHHANRSSQGRLPRALQPLPTTVRTLYTSRDEWRNATWKDKAKAGAVVAAGVGVFVVVSSVALSVVVTGVVGLGAYGLYRSFRDSRGGNSAWSSSSKNNALFNNLGRTKVRGGNPLTAGMPLVLQGLMTGLFSLVGGAMKQSMGRIATIQKAANQRLQGHPAITRQFGPSVEVASPQQVVEQTVNGVGVIQASFPVGGQMSRAYVRVKATVDANNDLSYQQFQYVNSATGDSIDLLHPSPSSSRTKVIKDAEFRDV